MIKVQNLTKFFGAQRVLNDISFHIRPGEVVALMGSSGSGKTTLLRCLNKLESFESGAVFIGGEDISHSVPQKVALQLGVGMIFQGFHLFEHKTVMENLLYAPLKQKRDVKDRAIELLERFDLSALTHAYPSKLSGGQKQRVAILRALLLEPKVLLFDEPTSALDPENVSDVVRLIKSLGEMGITMVIVSHELHFIKNAASRILFLDEGAIIEDDAVSDFFVAPKTKRAGEFLKHFLY
jgi:polar amino acid transport system ATP-binding protein